MSLKQKYTWNDFKREQGDKAKDLKRTSAEGLKAFEAAKKEKLKTYVKNRVALAKKARENAEKDVVALRKSLKGIKSAPRKTAILSKIQGRQRAAKNFAEGIDRDEKRTF